MKLLVQREYVLVMGREIYQAWMTDKYYYSREHHSGTYTGTGRVRVIVPPCAPNWLESEAVTLPMNWEVI